MKTGITGASGHTGANLIRLLIREKHTIRVLQHKDRKALSGLNISITEGSLEDIDSLSRFCTGLDVVIHLAAQISIRNNSFSELYKTNVRGTMNLLNAARAAGVKRFIHFSSIHALDHYPLDQPMDETRPLVLKAKMPYERTKALAEEWVRQQQSQDFDVIVLHPTAIMGPCDFKPSLLGQFLIRLYKGKLPGIIHGGYDWVDVRDICEATLNALHSGRGGECYILSGKWLSIPDFTTLFSKVTSKKLHMPILPLWLAYVGIPFIFIYALIMRQHPLYTFKSLTILQRGNRNISHAKAEKELGYKPRPLEETIRDAIEWFKESGMIG